MKIKLKRVLIKGGKQYSIGEIVDLDKVSADRLIQFGQAEAVVDVTPTKPKTTIESIDEGDD